VVLAFIRIICFTREMLYLSRSEAFRLLSAKLRLIGTYPLYVFIQFRLLGSKRRLLGWIKRFGEGRPRLASSEKLIPLVQEGALFGKECPMLCSKISAFIARLKEREAQGLSEEQNEGEHEKTFKLG
jgi:hypothetical protein